MGLDYRIVGEIVVRVILAVIFLITEEMRPFHAFLENDDMMAYKKPLNSNTVSTRLMFSIAMFVPIGVITLTCILSRKGDRRDMTEGILAITLALALNGVFTNAIKLMVGRPRPDFFWRCFPDGAITDDLKCTGDPDTVIEGRKSFPSGHSSFSFTGLVFTSLYMAGKLKVFQKRRSESWRLCLVLIPWIAAILIALSRYEDYRHHWQDITVGSLIGVGISTLCYHQYYPCLNSHSCALPRIVQTQEFGNFSFSETKGGGETMTVKTI